MSNEEKILQLLETQQKTLEAQQAELRKINKRLDTMDNKLDDLIEEHSMTREGVNKLLAWADEAGYIIKFPLDKAN